MNYSREIELKFEVKGAVSLSQVTRDVSAVLNDHYPYQATSYDLFWSGPDTSCVDFVRLRENSRELTVKVTDRGETFNRIEENVVVDDIKAAERLMTLLYGPPKSLTKTFSVWHTALPGVKSPGVVCVYQAQGDSRVFLECEADDEDSVVLMAGFVARYFELVREPRSLYQVFFGEGK